MQNYEEIWTELQCVFILAYIQMKKYVRCYVNVKNQLKFTLWKETTEAFVKSIQFNFRVR